MLGKTSVAIKGGDWAVIATEKKVIGNLRLTNMFRISKQIGCVMTGRTGKNWKMMKNLIFILLNIKLL